MLAGIHQYEIVNADGFDPHGGQYCWAIKGVFFNTVSMPVFVTVWWQWLNPQLYLSIYIAYFVPLMGQGLPIIWDLKINLRGGVQFTLVYSGLLIALLIKILIY